MMAIVRADLLRQKIQNVCVRSLENKKKDCVIADYM